jgi:cytochrome c553
MIKLFYTSGSIIAICRYNFWCRRYLLRLIGSSGTSGQHQRMRINLGVLAVVLLARSLTLHAADLDTVEQRALPCLPCHGKEGRAGPDGYYPRIAGKPARYLLNQLVNFRDGRRYFPMMNYLTERQPEAYLAELAEYFSSQKLPYDSVSAAGVPESTLARGKLLAKNGDKSADLPACSACHGENLLGALPSVPGLLGVSRSYLDAQLAAWRTDLRHAEAPDCMATIARRMKPADIEAVTAWLATQTVPQGAGPQESVPAPQPVECASIP